MTIGACTRQQNMRARTVKMELSLRMRFSSYGCSARSSARQMLVRARRSTHLQDSSPLYPSGVGPLRQIQLHEPKPLHCSPALLLLHRQHRTSALSTAANPPPPQPTALACLFHTNLEHTWFQLKIRLCCREHHPERELHPTHVRISTTRALDLSLLSTCRFVPRNAVVDDLLPAHHHTRARHTP
jgi:hypothetical protein